MGYATRIVGKLQSFGLVRYLHREMHLDLATLQTAMFMQLVVAGHLLLFSTRSRGFFFQPPAPEWKFFSAIMGTQVLAALLAANGWLVNPISWRLIGLIWVYNLAWLAVLDVVKVGLFRRHDRREAKQANWQKWFHSPLDSFGGRLGKPLKAE